MASWNTVPMQCSILELFKPQSNDLKNVPLRTLCKRAGNNDFPKILKDEETFHRQKLRSSGYLERLIEITAEISPGAIWYIAPKKPVYLRLMYKSYPRVNETRNPQKSLLSRTFSVAQLPLLCCFRKMDLDNCKNRRLNMSAPHVTCNWNDTPTGRTDGFHNGCVDTWSCW